MPIDKCPKAVQLAIEYHPMPPFDSGSPAKTTPDVVESAKDCVTEAFERALA